MNLSSPVVVNPRVELPFVEAPLNYLKPMVEKPVYYIHEPTAGIARDNASYDIHTLPIYNARSLMQNLSLDREGFVFIKHTSHVRNFYDENEIFKVYYPEAEQLLKQVTTAARVLVFDHNLRNAQRAQLGEQGIQKPVDRVHNDFTAKSGYSRARIVLDALGVDRVEAEAFLQHRFSIINVWRPIAEPVQSSPLAVCDAQTIALEDLVVRDLVYRDRIGETYAVTYNRAHQWFYFPQMRCSEAIFIKCFDSADTVARFTAHTAFDDPTTVLEASARESIELRALVFYST